METPYNSQLESVLGARIVSYLLCKQWFRVLNVSRVYSELVQRSISFYQARLNDMFFLFDLIYRAHEVVIDSSLPGLPRVDLSIC